MFWLFVVQFLCQLILMPCLDFFELFLDLLSLLLLTFLNVFGMSSFRIIQFFDDLFKFWLFLLLKVFFAL